MYLCFSYSNQSTASSVLKQNLQKIKHSDC